MAQFAKSTFSHTSYAAFRPSYPPSLYNTVLAYHHGSKETCVDLGCGSGTVARALSPSFAHVIGTDPSHGMIETAQSSTPEEEYPNVHYRESSAENLPFLGKESVDLVVAGQAAHWFDYPRLWPEMKRILRKGGTLAFWGYKDHVFVDHLRATKILDDYSNSRKPDKLGHYWSLTGRTIVEDKYHDIHPPSNEWEDIQRIEYEPGTNGPKTGEGTMYMSRKIRLDECKKYIRTWSAYSSWLEKHPGSRERESGGKGDVVDVMFEEMREVEPEWQGEGWEEKEVKIEWGSGLLLARRR